jgi:murein DD-endopeptidase MepM/ murein hydrolase activator NlpD
MKLNLHPPLDGNLLGRRVNRTLHGRSKYRPANVSGHNVVRGYNHAGTGDAVDLFGNAGEPIYAMLDGRVTAITDGNGRLSAVYISGKVGSHLVDTISAHVRLKDGLHVGQAVHRGEVIGYIGRELVDPHLHLEVWIGGAALAAKDAAGLAKKISDQVEARAA